MPMVRRHRYAVALVCLAALVVALGLPGVGLLPGVLPEPVASVAPPAGPRERITDASHRPDSAVRARSLAPRAPPLA
jgi:hypothetical protein